MKSHIRFMKRLRNPSRHARNFSIKVRNSIKFLDSNELVSLITGYNVQVPRSLIYSVKENEIMEFDNSIREAIACLREEQEISKMCVRVEQAISDDKLLTNEILNILLINNSISLVDILDLPKLSRISYFGMSYFYSRTLEYEGTILDRSNNEWYNFTSSLLSNSSYVRNEDDIDEDDRVDLADLDSLHAFYMRLLNTDAVDAIYRRCQEIPDGDKITNLIIKYYDDLNRIVFLKQHLTEVPEIKSNRKSNMNALKPVIEHIFMKIENDYPDEKYLIPLTRIIRFFENKLMYIAFTQYKHEFCHQIATFNAPLLHFAPQEVLSTLQVDKLSDFKGSKAAEWFSDSQCQVLNRKYFYKLKFNHRLVKKITQVILKTRPKWDIVIKFTLIYYKLCKEIALFASHRLVEYKINEYATKRDLYLSNDAKRILFSFCDEIYSERILSSDARITQDRSISSYSLYYIDKFLDNLTNRFRKYRTGDIDLSRFIERNLHEIVSASKGSKISSLDEDVKLLFVSDCDNISNTEAGICISNSTLNDKENNYINLILETQSVHAVYSSSDFIHICNDICRELENEVKNSKFEQLHLEIFKLRIEPILNGSSKAMSFDEIVKKLNESGVSSLKATAVRNKYHQLTTFVKSRLHREADDSISLS